MDIRFKCDKHLTFGDLRCGEVFCFVDDLSKGEKALNFVYMRVGRDPSDKGAANLLTGIIYSFEASEPVIKYEAELSLRKEEWHK